MPTVTNAGFTIPFESRLQSKAPEATPTIKAPRRIETILGCPFKTLTVKFGTCVRKQPPYSQNHEIARIQYQTVLS